MKKLLLIVCLMFSISCYSQVDSTRSMAIDPNYMHIQKAANLFDKFHRQAILGIGTQFIGGTLIAGAYLDENPNKALLISGVAVTTVGLFIFVNSYLHVHDAAIELRRVKPASTGIGLSYSF